MVRWVAALLVLATPVCANCATAQRVGSASAACSLATAKVMAELHQPSSHVADCEALNPADVPRGYYVLTLRGHCREPEGCGSTLIGWYAVRKGTRQVFEWNVANWKLDRRVP